MKAQRWIVRHELCEAEWVTNPLKHDAEGKVIPPSWCTDCGRVISADTLTFLGVAPPGCKHRKAGKARRGTGEEADSSVEFSYSFRSSITRRDLHELSDAKVESVMATMRSLGREVPAAELEPTTRGSPTSGQEKSG